MFSHTQSEKKSELKSKEWTFLNSGYFTGRLEGMTENMNSTINPLVFYCSSFDIFGKYKNVLVHFQKSLIIIEIGWPQG